MYTNPKSNVHNLSQAINNLQHNTGIEKQQLSQNFKKLHTTGQPFPDVPSFPCLQKKVYLEELFH
jgi:hypothetical protein